MMRTKRVGDKYVHMKKNELVAALRAFDAKKHAQPLASPKTKLDKKKVRQASEKYKVKRSLRRAAHRPKQNAPKAKLQRSLRRRVWTQKQRAAERARQRTEAYKENKQIRENTPEAKIKRKQRKHFFFGKTASVAGPCCAD